MRIPAWLAGGLLVALAAVGYFTLAWWTSPERAIKQRLRGLGQTLSVPAGSNDMSRLTRLAQLRHYFAADVHLRLGAGGPEIASRDELMGILSVWTPPPGGWTIEFMDVTVAMDPGSSRARVQLTAKVSSRDQATGQPTVDAREANVSMAKQDGEWVIATAETAETLVR